MKPLKPLKPLRTRSTRGPEDARLGPRASRRAAESRGRARLGSTGRVSALEGAEALLERISLARHAHTHTTYRRRGG
jgi:hypothetical protein